VLGAGCAVHNNVSIQGATRCGEHNEFFPGCVVGEPPQDLKYRGQPTRLEIGHHNIFRELVTIHLGTEVAGGVTRIGSHNRFLVGVHLAHDVQIGDACILSNYVQLAGHIRLCDRVTIGGLVGIHHFTTIGTLAYIGGLSRIVADVPPYMIIEGNPSRIRGYNETGMRRWGFDENQILAVRGAYRTLFSPRAESSGLSMLERLDQLVQRGDINGEVRHLCESVRRSLRDGVYGRHLESLRQDSDSDRERFYRTDIKDVESNS
jgi:UDP-N-acetylglucosamine acyltransferase